MNKKVLVISGSPRKNGNSDTLCDEFVKGATEAGNSVEKISLREKIINFCTGCYACKNNGKCIQKDDMADILDKMMNADVILMATPVYFYTMDGQMKTLIDRTVPLYSRMRNKDMYFIASAAVNSKSSIERTIDGFRGFTDCYEGFKEKGVIYAAGVWKIGEVNNTKYMTEAYEMGKKV